MSNLMTFKTCMLQWRGDLGTGVGCRYAPRNLIHVLPPHFDLGICEGFIFKGFYMKYLVIM